MARASRKSDEVDPDTGMSLDAERRARPAIGHDSRGRETRQFDPAMQQLAARMMKEVSEKPKVYKEQWEVPVIEPGDDNASIVSGAPPWVDPGWAGMDGTGESIINVPINGANVQPYATSPAHGGDTVTRYTDEEGRSVFRVEVMPLAGYEVIDGAPPPPIDEIAPDDPNAPTIDQPDGGVGEAIPKDETTAQRKEREAREESKRHRSGRGSGG
jgi:hypothetical protein